MARKNTSTQTHSEPRQDGIDALDPYRRNDAAKNGHGAGGTNARGRKWTVMVYMAAQDTLDLEGHAIRDLQEMERVSNEQLNIVVQINRHWPSRAQQYHVENKRSTLIEGNIASEDTKGPDGIASEAAKDPMSLKAFLKAVLKDERYKADQYFLVLWGHAYGLGFGRDHNELLRLTDIKSALEGFKTDRGKELDLLGANACALSYAEAAYELKDVARYMVASQIAVPFAGWPYESILRRITGDMPAEILGRIVVDSYVNQFNASPSCERVAMTLLNLKYGTALRGLVKELADSLTDAIRPDGATDSDRLTQIRTAFLATTAGDVRPLVDLFDLSEELVDLCKDLETLEGGENDSITRILSAATKIRDFVEPLGEQVGVSVPTVRNTKDDPFVVFHKRHQELDELHGVGIFAPFVAHPNVLERLGLLAAENGGRTDSRSSTTKPVDGQPKNGQEEYARLRLVEGTGWPELVYDKLRQDLPTEIVINVQNTGAVTRAETSAVTQMLVSIDSAFNKLDRKLATTKLQFFPALPPESSSSRTSQQSARVALLSRKSQRSAAATARFALLELLPAKELEAILKKKAPKGNGAIERNQERHDDAAESFRKLERAVTELERAAKRTLTHGTFGLGPPDGAKPGLGLTDEDKPGLGLTDEDKPGLGLTDEDKPGLGLTDEDKPGLGLGPQHFNGNGQGTARSVAQLFGQVGRSLRDLERAAAILEGTTAAILLEPRFGGAERIERAFKVLAETSLAARRTMKRVLSHPMYGLGPGLKSLGAEDRLMLAEAGGLSSRRLTLL